MLLVNLPQVRAACEDDLDEGVFEPLTHGQPEALSRLGEEVRSQSALAQESLRLVCE